MAKDNGKVLIHGKEYQTVASRVSQFRDAHTWNYSIETNLISRDESTVVMKAWITDLSNDKVVATGYAEENRNASTINKTSALENCETSAIGRALAAFGLAGTEYASADEVAQAVSVQQQSKPTGNAFSNLATPKQKALIKEKLNQNGVADEDMKGYLIEQYGVNGDMTKDDASSIIEDLIGAKV